MLLVIVVATVVLAAAILLRVFRFSKSLKPSQRGVLLVVVVLGLAYALPKIVQGAMRGFQTGAEIRQRQGR